jgi:hypothetical protein
MSCVWESSKAELDLSEFLADRDAPAWREFRAHYAECRNCSKAVADWRSLENRLADRSGGEGHPVVAELVAFGADPMSLGDERRVDIELHTQSCGPCASQLSVLRSFDASEFRERLNTELTSSVSKTAEQSAEAPTRAAQLSGWLLELMEPLLAPALRPALAITAILLLIGVPVMLRLASPAGQPQDAPSRLASQPDREPTADIAPSQIAKASEEPPAPQSSANRDKEPPQKIRIADGSKPLIGLAPDGSAPRPAPASASDAPTPLIGTDVVMLAAHFPHEPLFYDPSAELLGQTGMRITTLVRGGAQSDSILRVLVPDHVGLTANSSPKLYYVLNHAVEGVIEISIADRDSIDPLLIVRSEGGADAGLHALDLSKHDVRLEEGVLYEWFVSLPTGESNHDEDMVAGGAIRRVAEPEQALATEPSTTTAAATAHRQAAAGFFYDALQTLSDWLEQANAQHPEQTARIRSARRALLNAAGLAALREDGQR